MALLHVTPLFGQLFTVTTGTGTLAYTVPAGDRVVLRNITFRNVSSATGQSLLVYISGVLYYSYFLAVSESHQQDFWIVLGPGTTISCRVGSATGINAIGSGSIYTI